MADLQFPRLSAPALQKLVQKSKNITIKWKFEMEDDLATILFNSYPEDVAVRFSRAIQGQITIANRIAVVIGGVQSSVIKILKWFVHCCQCGQKKAFPYATDLPFTNAFLDGQSARVLETPWLVAEIINHMNTSRPDLISPMYVEALLDAVMPNAPIVDTIVSYIAEKIWIDMKARHKAETQQDKIEKSTKNMVKKSLLYPSDQYIILREEIPLIGDGVKRIIDARLADIAAQKKAREEARARWEQREKNNRTAWRNNARGRRYSRQVAEEAVQQSEQSVTIAEAQAPIAEPVVNVSMPPASQGTSNIPFKPLWSSLFKSDKATTSPVKFTKDASVSKKTETDGDKTRKQPNENSKDAEQESVSNWADEVIQVDEAREMALRLSSGES